MSAPKSRHSSARVRQDATPTIDQTVLEWRQRPAATFKFWVFCLLVVYLIRSVIASDLWSSQMCFFVLDCEISEWLIVRVVCDTGIDPALYLSIYLSSETYQSHYTNISPFPIWNWFIPAVWTDVSTTKPLTVCSLTMVPFLLQNVTVWCANVLQSPPATQCFALMCVFRWNRSLRIGNVLPRH